MVPKISGKVVTSRDGAGSAGASSAGSVGTVSPRVEGDSPHRARLWMGNGRGGRPERQGQRSQTQGSGPIGHCVRVSTTLRAPVVPASAKVS